MNNNKLLRKILLENIINAGAVVSILVLVEVITHMIGYNGNEYIIRSKGAIAQFGLDIGFPIMIIITGRRFVATTLDFFFLRIDEKKLFMMGSENLQTG